MFAPPEEYIPQQTSIRRPLMVWTILLMGSLLFVALIIAAPVAVASQHGFLAATLYQGFSYVCHQAPERSFFIANRPFAVCARCTGLYMGFALAALIYPLLTSLRRTNPPKRKWLFLAVVPLAIDFGLGFLGIWENTHASRFVTGSLFGAVVVFYVMPALVELSQRFSSRRSPRGREGNPELRATQPASAPSDYSTPLRRI